MDFATTTNKGSNSLWCLNMKPDLVRSHLGSLRFSSTYDAKLLNTIGEYGIVDSCVALLRHCIAIVEHLKSNASNNAKVRSLEAQLKEVLFEKNKASNDFALKIKQSQERLKMLETELS